MKSPQIATLACISLLVSHGSAILPESNHAYIFAQTGTIDLKSDGVGPDIKILDFGQNVEGHPTFEVVSVNGDTSMFEISFAESVFAFDNYMSDGPLPLAAAMETYRVNRYNISQPSVHENRLIQGAFRYQKLNLSTAGEIKLQNIGARQTVHTTPLDSLPGFFECSDEDLNRIWRTGARSVQLTEIPKNTINDFWVVTEEGSLIDSLAPQALVSAGAGALVTYELAFDVNPITGAFTFGLLMDTLNDGIQIAWDVVSGTITAVASNELLGASQMKPLSTGAWISVTATVNLTDISIAVNSRTVLSFSQQIKFYGSFGLGAPFGHSARFRNLVATDLTGASIYSSTLTDHGFLDDFLMGSNPADTIVDGSRRDRIAYNGDLDIAAAATFVSTYGVSFVEGSLELLGSFQLTPGFFVPTAKIQQSPLSLLIPANRTGLIGYSFNLVTAFAQAYLNSGNISFAERWTPAVTLMLDWAHSQLSQGVFTLDDPSLAGDWNYYDPPQIGASSKFNAVYAYALQQSLEMLEDAGADTGLYNARLVALRSSMQDQLWDADLGAYVLSSENPYGFAQDAQALAILAGVPQASNISTQALLSTMERELLLPAGPLAFTNITVDSGFAQKISPYASSYHLRAAFETGEAAMALKLLRSLWAPMADPSNANYTNCFWETLDPDGTPGLGIFTSLCHGWGAGPTADLSMYVLGGRPTAAGFAQWMVKPMTLGLTSAKGRQRTPKGDIEVEWSFNEKGLLRMKASGPQNGHLHLPTPLRVSASDGVFLVNGESVQATEFPIMIAGEVTIEQQKKRPDCTRRQQPLPIP